MFKNLLLVGALAGMLTGSLLSILQHLYVIPLIHQAEQYETQPAGFPASPVPHQHGEEAAEWKPEEGMERLGFTWLANVGIATGFGWMMAGIMTFRRCRTLIQSIVYGLSGYYVFFVAPALLLPPELPGADSPNLPARQAIWLCSVIFALLGVSILAYTTNWLLRISGLLVISSPFLVFTRHVVTYSDPVPLVLINRFALSSGLTNLFFWIVLGISVSWLCSKLVNPLTVDHN